MMDQNTIALIWDFDKTLIDGYMQEPIFRKFNVDAAAFWKEVNALPGKYAKQGVKVNPETIYLNHLLSCVRQGIFKGLNNEMLFRLGAELEFYDGIPEILKKLKDVISKDDRYAKFGIHVEHYIVSTGLTEMIKGSSIAEYTDGIWGCEFIETTVPSGLEIKEPKRHDTGGREIREIGYIIDNTSKTRAIFEINKGANKFEDIDVNSKIKSEDRRVPFEYMIYIADGPSDVPAFSVLNKHGGKTFAIYPVGDDKAFGQVNQLRQEDRINMFAEANYSEGTTAYMWLLAQTKSIAEDIYAKHDEAIKRSASQPPKHL